MDTYRKIFLPYCLQRLNDGRYIVLNRKYKPLGISASDWVTYENHPTVTSLKLTPSIIKKLSIKSDPNPESIYLYKDGSVPTDSRENWEAYSKRLEILAKVTLE